MIFVNMSSQTISRFTGVFTDITDQFRKYYMLSFNMPRYIIFVGRGEFTYATGPSRAKNFSAIACNERIQLLISHLNS